MKFCQRLREQREVFDGDIVKYLLDYKKLKKRIGVIKKGSGEATKDDIELWMRGFKEEVQKFDGYFNETMKECEEEVESYEKSLGLRRPVKKTAIKDAYVSLQELKFFLELNRTATRKILKKLDKNVSGYNVSGWREEEGNDLFSSKEEPLGELSQRLTSVYAALFHGSRAKIAEMELDYHVSCVSDLFSFMMCHTGMLAPVKGV
eukprot:TRINITY_DN13125_c0_g1_i1.p1 TRINITY_DN13125_c0_g1~~TRINITY_DN13125_c0_g1_i1.p1  ORF type:complete len:221 (+),score=67.19 TRINITY_DN13125_c0_g1_i1:50-664(+)